MTGLFGTGCVGVAEGLSMFWRLEKKHAVDLSDALPRN